jgi:hypothetical protein
VRSRSVTDATALAGDYLLAVRNAGEGWGYISGDASLVEPSATAVLALDALSGDAGIAVAWLLAAQNDDGGWGIAADDDESGWHTAWALLALAARPAAAEQRDAGLNWLLGNRSLQVREPDDPNRRDTILQIDLSLTAWPWLHDQAAWVEPTAQALVALSRCGVSPTHARVDEAVRYLVDRRCRQGGWNFGNPYMFVALPPRAQATAWAVMALHACAPDSVTAADVAVLRAENESDGGAMAAALTVLCLHRLGEEADAESAALLALQGDDGSWEGSSYFTALAVLALTGAVL